VAFTCATQLARHQRVDILGTAGRIEVEIPVNPPGDRPSRIWLQRGASAAAPGAPGAIEEIVFEPCNQYTLQGDAFSLAIIKATRVPTPLDDAVANMRAIDAAKASADGGGWIDLG
jgi:predicted dehydrogenase